MELALEPLHRGGADRQVLTVLYIPHDTLRPQVRPQHEDMPCPLHDLLRYPSCRRDGWSALRKSRDAVSFSHPLNRARTGSV
jgi:hypothetical protein